MNNFIKALIVLLIIVAVLPIKHKDELYIIVDGEKKYEYDYTEQTDTIESLEDEICLLEDQVNDVRLQRNQALQTGLEETESKAMTDAIDYWDNNHDFSELEMNEHLCNKGYTKETAQKVISLCPIDWTLNCKERAASILLEKEIPENKLRKKLQSIGFEDSSISIAIDYVNKYFY